MTAPRATSVLRALAALACTLLAVLFVSGVAGVFSKGFDLLAASIIGSTGVAAALLGVYAYAGQRPEVARRMRRALNASGVGCIVGIPVTALTAELLAPGSETAPVLVAMFVMPIMGTLGLIVGWLLPVRPEADPTTRA